MNNSNFIDFLVINAPPGFHQDSLDLKRAKEVLGTEGHEICYFSWDDSELSIDTISKAFHLEIYQNDLC